MAVVLLMGKLDKGAEELIGETSRTLE